MNVLQFDALGRLVEKQERVNQKCLVSIRVMIEKINSEQTGKSIGSILFANSYLYFDDSNHICVTEAVPNLLQWHTNKSHYGCTARQAMNLNEP